jgi:glycosyltransferase involved in cell wall biosynthesis
MSKLADNPRVSVLIPSYNHGKYISQAIYSVLNQTYQNFEIIITDDGSSDDSVEIIRGISDSRIHLYIFEQNRGPAHAVMNCIDHAKGEYYALLNSDDMWDHSKLEKQVNFLDENPTYGAVFSDVKFIYEDGTLVNLNDFSWASIFTQKNRTRGKWMRRFFFELNCICHPSVLIRKHFYNSRKLHCDALRQLPDFNLWIEIVKKTSIHILEDRLVLFRVLKSTQNTSADTPTNKVRNINEILLILRNYFEHISYEVFIEGFGDLLVHQECQDDIMMKCEQAFLFFKMESELTLLYQIVGIEKLYYLLQQPEAREILKNQYNFTERDFYNITGKVDILHVLGSSIPQQLCVDGSCPSLSRRLRNFVKRQIAKL